MALCNRPGTAMILNDRLSTRHAVDMEVNLILPGALYTRNISSPPCHRPTATGAGVFAILNLPGVQRSLPACS